MLPRKRIESGLKCALSNAHPTLSLDHSIVIQQYSVLKVVSMDIQDVLKLASPDLFLPELEAKDKDGVLEEMVEVLLKDRKLSNKDAVLSMLKSRESMGSTAVGPGIAFPHGRTLATADLIIVIARSSEGVAFDSIDGNPTHLFFMLIAPPQDTGNQYIRSLAVLTEKLGDEDIRTALLGATDYETFSTVLTGE
jgi:PTS system nitrogen regulatory IIA component